MRRSLRMVSMAAVLAAAVAMATGCFAADENSTASAAAPAGQEHEKGMMREDMMKDLNLTPEQSEQLKAHREANKETMKALREAMKAKRAELQQEVARAEVDMAKLDTIKAAMKELDGKLVDQRIDSILSLKKILTPEQFQKMNARMEEHKGAHKGKRQDKDAGMPPPPHEGE